MFIMTKHLIKKMDSYINTKSRSLQSHFYINICEELCFLKHYYNKKTDKMENVTFSFVLFCIILQWSKKCKLQFELCFFRLGLFYPVFLFTLLY